MNHSFLRLPDSTIAVKLGKRAPRLDPRTLRMAKYTKALPPPPDNCGYVDKVINWPMDLNDAIGDCLVGDTQIAASNVSEGVRVKYRGPVVTLVFDSGNRITVTPNHAVLTPRGFVPACLLNQGDNVISSRFPQEVSARLQPDFDHAPTTVEEKFNLLLSSQNGSFRKMVPLPVDFNGDARFMDGDVDVISPSSFLHGKSDRPLSQPHREDKIRSSGKLHGSLHGDGSFLKRQFAGRSTPLGSIGGHRDGTSLFNSHASVKEFFGVRHPSQFDSGIDKTPFYSLAANSRETLAYILHAHSLGVSVNRRTQVRQRVSARVSNPLGLPLGSKCKASSLKPSVKSGATDAHLPSQIFSMFPGLVTRERIREVYVNRFEGHVFDFTNDSRWYLANGIITHNCTIAAAAHMIQQWSLYAGKPFVPSDAQILAAYEAVSGYNPNNPNSDNGAVILDVLRYWKKVGIAGHKIAAFVSVDPRNQTEIKQAIQLFGNCYIGIALPIFSQNPITGVNGLPVWNLPPGGPTGDGAPWSWGGHCVPLVGYGIDSAGNHGTELVSWGQLFDATWGYLAEYSDEMWAVLSQDWIEADGLAPSGFNVAQLQADLALL